MTQLPTPDMHTGNPGSLDLFSGRALLRAVRSLLGSSAKGCPHRENSLSSVGFWCRGMGSYVLRCRREVRFPVP